MKDLNISVENGVKTLELRTGAALELKEPKIITVSGVLDTPFKWLEKRVAEIEQQKAHIIVNRERMSITLALDERDYYSASISGKMELHPAFVKLGINSGKYITTLEMAELFKMNRSYFENRQATMDLVTLLRNFKAKIDKQVEIEHNPNKGDRRVLIAQTIDSNLPPSFNFVIPIFKGTNKVTIECETYFNPDDLTCCLVSAGANETAEDTKDSSIDEVLGKIIEIAPNIAILEV